MDEVTVIRRNAAGHQDFSKKFLKHMCCGQSGKMQQLLMNSFNYAF